MTAATTRDRDGGFLLAETLATFGITATVLISLVVGAATLLIVSDRTIDHVETNDRFHQTMQTFVRALSHVTRARWNGNEPQRFIFSGTDRALLFVMSGSNGPTGASRIVKIREIDAGDDTRLTWQEAPLSPLASGMADIAFETPHDVTLPGVRLRFAYIEERWDQPQAAGGGSSAEPGKPPAPVRARRTERIHASWPSRLALPTAILIKAETSDRDRPITTLRVNLLNDADIGCIEPAEKSLATNGSSAVQGPPSANVPQAPPPDTAVPGPAPMPQAGIGSPQAPAQGGPGGPGGPAQHAFCARSAAQSADAEPSP
jgi:hypothetical protein